TLTNDFKANDTYATEGNNDPDSYLKTAAYLDEGPEAFKAGEDIVVTGTAMVGWSGLKRVEHWLRPDACVTHISFVTYLLLSVRGIRLLRNKRWPCSTRARGIAERSSALSRQWSGGASTGALCSLRARKRCSSTATWKASRSCLVMRFRARQASVGLQPW